MIKVNFWDSSLFLKVLREEPNPEPKVNHYLLTVNQISIVEK